ncbi:MAG: NAD(P)H-dependent oxidoreductase [Saprospiraceae bacterium]|nr:NAD(P)H-dependent oxidoreductase [Saprospiraceae bacterium]
MRKKVVAFGASNSRNSINKQFANFAAQQIPGAEVEVLDLNDYEMPIYSIDREKEFGIPQLAQVFKAKIQAADFIIISFAEHNGSYTVAFKNIMDWISRLEGSTWANKSMFLLATSPGGRGGKTVLDLAARSFSFMTKGSIQSFSLPSFHQNFSKENGITDELLQSNFTTKLQSFLKEISDVPVE